MFFSTLIISQNKTLVQGFYKKTKIILALWRVLDLNERAASRRGQAPAIASKQNEKEPRRAKRNAAWEKGNAAKPLGDRPFFIPLGVRSFLRPKPPGCTPFSPHFVLPCIGVIGGKNRLKCPLL